MYLQASRIPHTQISASPAPTTTSYLRIALRFDDHPKVLKMVRSLLPIPFDVIVATSARWVPREDRVKSHRSKDVKGRVLLKRRHEENVAYIEQRLGSIWSWSTASRSINLKTETRNQTKFQEKDPFYTAGRVNYLWQIVYGRKASYTEPKYC